ncbi:MAG TPA: hypothetical protein VFN13_05720 [Rudaea sp.]|nr:hypothetical protein [Rudaea sp.]
MTDAGRDSVGNLLQRWAEGDSAARDRLMKNPCRAFARATCGKIAASLLQAR